MGTDWRMRSMQRRVDVGMSIGQSRQEAGTPVDAVKWRVGSLAYWRKVDINLKKSIFKPLTNLATDTVEEVELVVENETGVVVES